MPTDTPRAGPGTASGSPFPAIPLSGWAGRQLAIFFQMTGRPVPAELTGAGLLVERAAVNGLAVPGAVSAGGGCRLIPARHGGWVALNLARDDDRLLLPALFEDGDLDPRDDTAIAARMAGVDAGEIVCRGRSMGLALAAIDEQSASPATTITAAGPARTGPRQAPPLVVDLSALWAGPLCGHLFLQAAAHVVKVESRTRPDAMRDGDPALFALVNQGKASVALDLHDPADRDALVALIRRADIVIEAARPRALLQLGIDADALVREVPGLVWLTITGHGILGEAAHWVGFGDDCSVAAGLTAAIRDATGTIGFGGDAVADPLTGIVAAGAGWQRWASGTGGRITISMTAVTRAALNGERNHDPAGLYTCLKQWSASAGQRIAYGPSRMPRAVVAPFGSDSARWLRAAR